jgi:uncharacterized protein
MKYLLIIAIALVVWLTWKKRSLPSGKASTPASREPEQMVVCAHCGVHLPVSDSVSEQGRHFCSEAHCLAARSPAGHD